MDKLKIHNIIFYSIVAVFLLFILRSNPFLRIPYDPWELLIQIANTFDTGNSYRSVFWPVGPNPRCLWYQIWSNIFKVICINDIFIWAKIIHVVQFTLSAVILYYFSKTALRLLINTPAPTNSAIKKNKYPSLPPLNKVRRRGFSDKEKEIQIKFLSLFAVLLWFIGNGTFSAEYQQSWIMWYSVNYQGLTIPLLWYSIALTLILFYEEGTLKKRIFFIVLLLIACAVMTKAHATEFLYYLIHLSLISLLNIKKVLTLNKKTKVITGISVVTAIFVTFILIIYFLPEYGILSGKLSTGNVIQIFQKIKSLGHIVVSGSNRFPNSFSEIAILSLIAAVIFKIICTLKPKKRFNVSVYNYLFFSSFLFFLIPMTTFLAGTAAFITNSGVVCRFFFASPWFIFIPYIVYELINIENISKIFTESNIYKLLVKNEKTNISLKEIFFAPSIITLTVILLLVFIIPRGLFSRNSISRTLSFETTIQNAKSIINSLDKKKVGVQYSEKDIEAIGEMVKKCEETHKGKPNLYFTSETNSITGGVGYKAYIIRGVFRKRVFGHRRKVVTKQMFYQRNLDKKFNLIDIDGDTPRLYKERIITHYKLENDYTLSSDGKNIPIIPNEIYGWIDKIANLNDRYYYLKRWAVDVKNSRLVDEILVFVDKKFIRAVQTLGSRPDIGKTFNKEHLVKVGYHTFFPSNIVNHNSDIRIIAVSNGRASELNYKEQGKYFRKLSDIKDEQKTTESKSGLSLKKIVLVFKDLLKSKKPALKIENNIITSTGGKEIMLAKKAFDGWVDNAEDNGKNIALSGWAADVNNIKLVDIIVLFVDGKEIGRVKTDALRLDVSKALNSDDLKLSGYQLSIPKEKLTPNSNVRIIAISGDTASELNYNENVIMFLKLNK